MRPGVADNDRIASERPIKVADLLKKAAGSMARLDTLARSAEQGLGQVQRDRRLNPAWGRQPGQARPR